MMMKRFTFAIILLLCAQLYAQNIDISLNPDNWSDYGTINTAYTKTQTSEGYFHVTNNYASGFANPAYMRFQSNTHFNIQNATVRFKWRVNNSPKYGTITNGVGGFSNLLSSTSPSYFTTNNVWQSTLIPNNTWVYTEIVVNPDKTWSFDYSYSGYGLGGLRSGSRTASDAVWDAFADTYLIFDSRPDSTTANFDIAEAYVISADPYVEITSPANGSVFELADSVTFSATATDVTEPCSFSWESDMDGALGDGNPLEIDDLSLGSHTITATCVDDASNIVTANITVDIIEPPVIESISNVTISEANTYTGQVPVLSQGSPFTTWSLEEGPLGMTIDDTTGQVSWSSPTTTGSPFTVTIRAENPVGFDEVSWQIDVMEIPEFATTIWTEIHEPEAGQGAVDGNDGFRKTTIDNEGNVIAAGYVDSYSGMNDAALLVKYDPNGSVIWSKSIDVPSASGKVEYNDSFSDVDVDSENNIVVVGSKSGTFQYVLGYYHTAWWVQKYSPDGQTLLWEIIWHESSQSAWGGANAVYIDEMDNIYVTGSSFERWGGAEHKWVTFKYDKNGNVLLGPISHNWINSINLQDYANDIVADSNGDIFITGSIGVSPVTTVSAIKNFDMHVRKLNGTTGATIWDDTYSGPTNRRDAGTGITIDPDDNVLVAGYTNTGTSNDTPDYDWLMIKYDNTTGTRLWEQTYESSPGASEPAYDTVSDTHGDFYVSGYMRNASDVLQRRIAKVSGVDGLTLAEAAWESEYTAYTHGIDISGDLISACGLLNNGINNDAYASLLTVEFAVQITGPATGSIFEYGQPVQLTAQLVGSAEPPFYFTWASDIDGEIGTGQSFEASGLSLGEHRITCTLDHSGNQSMQSAIYVNIIAAPDIELIDDETVTDAQPYTGPVPVLNDGAGTVGWSLVEGPAGMTIEPLTGVVSWASPEHSDIAYTITIQADNTIGSDTESWLLEVTTQPVITAIDNDSILENLTYTSAAPTLEKGTVPISWSLTESPAGMAIDPNTGVVSWPNAAASFSSYTITIQASNIAGTDSESWELTVLSPPLVNAIGDTTIIEGNSYTGPSPSLIKGNPAVTWSLQTGPAGMTISSTGVVSWANASEIGLNEITIRAENTVGYYDETWQLEVIAIPAINPISDESVMELMPYTGPSTLPSLSKGTEPITWSLAQGPSGMTINSATGQVSWPNAVPSFSPYDITIRATNSAGNDQESWQLMVLSPPVIGSMNNQQIDESLAYTGPVPVLSKGTAPVTWSVVAGEVPAGMTIDSSTGVVSWASPTTTGSPHLVTIHAENSVGNDKQSWTLEVFRVPTIADIANVSISDEAAYVGPTPALSDGTLPVEWSLIEGPAGMTINSSTGVVSWASPIETGSPHTVTISAGNIAGTDTESWQIIVISVPVIQSINSETIIEGTGSYTGPTPVLTKGTPTIIWSLIAGPAEMSIDPSTGVVSWSDPSADNTPHLITVTATNSVGFDDVSWQLNIVRPPVIKDILDITVVEETAYYSPTPSLLDGTPVDQWSLITAPVGMTINPSTGVVNLAAVSAAGSPHDITIQGENLAGSDTESWQLSVISKPEIQPIANDIINEGVLYTSDVPVLLKGTAPIQWSLVVAPDGMTIDASTGVISWPDPTAENSPHAVTIRAANSGGTDSVSFQIEVPVSYEADVWTDVELAPAGTPVQFYGQADFLDGSGPASNVEVLIHLYLKDTERILPVTTDVDGEFEYLFNPLVSEAGQYSVTADHPIVASEAAEDEFTLVGISVEPQSISQSVLTGGTVSGQIEITNLGDSTLTGIETLVEDMPANIIVDANSIGDLDPLASTSFGYEITAIDNSVNSAAATITITSVEGAYAEIPLNVDVKSIWPDLVTNTTELQSGMVRGEQTLVQFTVYNNGSDTTSQIQVYTPDVAWMSASPATIDPIEPGGFATVILSLTPDENMVLGAYTGTIVVAGTQTGVTIPYEFIAISDAVGNVLVKAVDEFTYYAEGEPKVADAQVKIIDVTTGDILSEGLTDADGEYLAADLPEAYYYIYVTAADHGDYRATVLVRPGLTKIISAFLSREVVKYTWSVVPTEIEDRYEFTLDVLFETDVPVPVLTIEPALFDLDSLEGEFTQVDYTITNHGLLAAKDSKFSVADHSIYEITPLVEDLGDIPAKSSIVVPVTIRDKTYSSLSMAAEVAERYLSTDEDGFTTMGSSEYCEETVKTGITYKIICGKDDRLKFEPVRFKYIDWWGCEYPPKDPPPPGKPCVGEGCGGDDEGDDKDILDWISQPWGGDDGDDDSGGGGNGSGGGYIPPYEPGTPDDHTPPPRKLGVPCSECGLAVAKSIASCLWSYVPMGTAGEILDLGMVAHECFNKPSISNCVSKVIDQAYGILIGALGDTVGQLYNVYACLRDIGGAIYSHCIYSSPQIDGKIAALNNMIGMGDAELDVAILALVEQYERLGSQMDALSEMFGDEKWLDVPEGEGDVFTFFIAEMQIAHDPNSTDGEGISPDEWTYLMDIPRPSQLTDADVEKTLARWNRTIEYAAAGIYYLEDVPEGQSTDFIASDTLDDKMNAAAEAAQANIDEGYNGILDGVFSAVESLEAELGDGAESICAKVSVQIKQEAVITRTAFEAELGIENAGSSPMEEVYVNLHITDQYGNDANDLFVVAPPDLVGINQIDGTDLIAASGSAKATWLIIPTSEAAPYDNTTYYIGGQFSYIMDGDTVTIPLYPDDIVVAPDAKLQVKYFHQRDVFSDDPFTDEVEPAEPYSLGLMMSNIGAGYADNVQMITAQPKIVENEKGLLIDFEIIGTQIGPYQARPSLEVFLGDIGPNETAVARWLMTSTLSGQFTQYNATYRHLDGLGDPRLSLIDSVEIYELTHVVLADHPTEDGIGDFLVNDIPDANMIPDTLYLSDGSVMPVAPASEVTADGSATVDDLEVEITASVGTGYNYIRVNDPSDGILQLASVIRSDGKSIPVGDNAWLTNRLIWEDDESYREKFLHIFDYDGTGSYTVIFTTDPTSSELRVDVGPVSAIDDGAQWNVDLGAWKDSGQTVLGLLPGVHTVQFKDIPGWITPAARQVITLTGQTLAINAEYVPQSAAVGSLEVGISPTDAVAEGAMWSIDGFEGFYNSGDIINGLTPGDYTVTFTDLINWVTPSDQVVTVQQDTTETLGGVYTRYEYTLTAEVIGGNGQVLPLGGTFDAGSIVKMAAIPSAGYRVAQWVGCDNAPAAGSNTNFVTIDANKTVSVEFELIPLNAYQLTVNTIGHGTVDPDSGSYDQDTIVMLTAYPDDGYQVKSWTNADNSPAAETNINAVTMDEIKTVTVEFEAVPGDMYSLNISISGNGTVAPSGGVYDAGSLVTLTATPDPGWHFVQWAGDVSSTNPSLEVLIDNNMNISAAFEENSTNQQPIAIIESIDPNTADAPMDIISFDGSASDSDGSIIEWLWTSDVDGVLGNTEDMQIPSYQLTPGTHEITFEVKDDLGLWSSPETSALTVQSHMISGTVYVDIANVSGVEEGTIANPFSMIQRGINFAADNAHVIVAQGTYYENINFNGKNLILTGTDPDDSQVISSTVINGGNAGPTVTFAGTEDPNCVLTGFTITAGSGSEQNDYTGGGICGGNETQHCLATITKCVIADNGTDCLNGGGIAFCDGLIANCIVANNTAIQSGAGLFECDGEIVNCSIVRNTASGYGGGMCSCNGLIKNCVFFENIAFDSGQNFDSAVPEYSCVQYDAAGQGCFVADPDFVDPNNTDFHLLPYSKCIDAGDPNSSFTQESEPDGGKINLGAYGNTPEATQSGALLLKSYHYVDYVRIGRTVYDYRYTMTMSNGSSEPVSNVQLELLSASDNIVLIDSFVTFDYIGAGQIVTSTDTFTLRIDNAYPVDMTQVSWRATFDWSNSGNSGLQENSEDICLDPIAGDFNCNQIVDLEDVGIMAENWLRLDCLTLPCDGTDMAPAPNGDGRVDMIDFAEFYGIWITD